MVRSESANGTRTAAGVDSAGLSAIVLEGPIAVSGANNMFGPAFLAESGTGFDLTPYGYVEEEYFVQGRGTVYDYDDDFRRIVAEADVPYLTRLVVRRPADSSQFNGTVMLEPLHLDNDRGITWNATAPYVVREGSAWIGVSVFPFPMQRMREILNPNRYASLSIPDAGLGYDIVKDIAVALRAGAAETLLGVAAIERLYMSGWSATGSFLRTFVNDGFHSEARTSDGDLAISGYLVCISGAGDPPRGYWPLSDRAAQLPATDPRRFFHNAGSPIFEILSEFEAESNAAFGRDDSDEPGDEYRLYEIPGGSHHELAHGPEMEVTQLVQLEQLGFAPPLAEMNEMPTDLRFTFIVRALYELLERWVRDGIAPPHAERFTVLDQRILGPHGIWDHAFPLWRDVHGNALGGIRTHWVGVPDSTYLPHSTPRPGRVEIPPGVPIPGPEFVADIHGQRIPFSVEKMRRLYGSSGVYAALAAAHIRQMVVDGWLLEHEAHQLLVELEAKPTWT